MNRILSGVETPEGKEGEGGAREWVDWVGEGIVVNEDCKVGERKEEDEGVKFGSMEEVEEPIVVLRCRFVVSAEGGGGRWFKRV